MYYNDKSDLARLSEMAELAPEEFNAWLKLDKITGKTDGKIPQKYRELIAVAVAHATQCSYCIDVHTGAAKKAGATKQEVVEAVLLAAALRAGGAAAHGAITMRIFDDN